MHHLQNINKKRKQNQDQNIELLISGAGHDACNDYFQCKLLDHNNHNEPLHMSGYIVRRPCGLKVLFDCGIRGMGWIHSSFIWRDDFISIFGTSVEEMGTCVPALYLVGRTTMKRHHYLWSIKHPLIATTCMSFSLTILFSFFLTVDASPRPDARTCPASCISYCTYSCLLRLLARPVPTTAPTRCPRLRTLGGHPRAYPTSAIPHARGPSSNYDGRWRKGREGRERRGEGEARRARKAWGRRRSPAAGHRPPAAGTNCSMCNTERSWWLEGGE
jgi:hypothetical protein